MNKKTYQKVERWLEGHSFHHKDFEDIGQLIELKREQGKKISVAIPTLNEGKTIGSIVRTIKKNLVKKYPLVDEIIVVDSKSTDDTKPKAKKAGAQFYYCDSVSNFPLAEARGKGSNLWASLYLTNGDIISWIDADIRNFHSKFVYGPVGVILNHKEIKYVKGFYERPLILNSEEDGKKKDFSRLGGGRVTELCFRPLINQFFPELTGFIQPLSGEYAGTREILENIPFYSGYSVETGHIINILEKFGLETMAQVDLDIRVHRNQEIESLRNMAFTLTETIIREARKRKRKARLDSKLYIPSYIIGGTDLEEVNLRDKEWPPIINSKYYKKKREISG